MRSGKSCKTDSLRIGAIRSAASRGNRSARGSRHAMDAEISIREEARNDLAEAFDWYEEQRLGLGYEFLISVEEALTQLRRFPQSAPYVLQNVRRASLRRFPYGVFYMLEDDAVVVLAVMHAKRDPKRWKERTEHEGE